MRRPLLEPTVRWRARRPLLLSGVVLACAAALLAGCAGPGYSIAGPAVRSPVPGLVLAGAELAPTRAHPRPEIDVLQLCPRGVTVAGGAVLELETLEDGRRRVAVARGDAAPQETLWLAPGSEGHLDIALGETMLLRRQRDGAIVACVQGYVAATATLLETGSWQIGALALLESVRLGGQVIAHGWDGRLRRFRLVVAGDDGQTLEIRYTPIGEQGLAARPLQQVALELRVAEAEAGFRGPSLVLRSQSGALLAALAAGGGLPRQELPGVVIRPSRRVVYSEARQMPSLCLASVEHFALEVRRGTARDELPPGTYLLVAHGEGDYRVAALDVSRPTGNDVCGAEVSASLSFAISQTTGAPVKGGATKTGARFDGRANGPAH